MGILDDMSDVQSGRQVLLVSIDRGLEYYQYTTGGRIRGELQRRRRQPIQKECRCIRQRLSRSIYRIERDWIERQQWSPQRGHSQENQC